MIPHLLVIVQAPSYVLMGISHETASSTQPLSLTPFGEACVRMDLTAIHEILEKNGYKDDEGVANEVCRLSPFNPFNVLFQHFMNPLTLFSCGHTVGRAFYFLPSSCE